MRKTGILIVILAFVFLAAPLGYYRLPVVDSATGAGPTRSASSLYASSRHVATDPVSGILSWLMAGSGKFARTAEVAWSASSNAVGQFILPVYASGITLVQGPAAATAGNTITINLAGSPTSGDLMVLTVAVTNGVAVNGAFTAITVKSVTGGPGGWNSITSYSYAGGDTEMWYAIVPPSGTTNTITVTLSGYLPPVGAYAIADAYEYSGINTSNPVDAHATGYGAYGQGPHTSTSCIRSYPYGETASVAAPANGLVVGTIMAYAQDCGSVAQTFSATYSSPATGWVLKDGSDMVSSNNFSESQCYYINPGQATAYCGVTFAAYALFYYTAIASFNASGPVALGSWSGTGATPTNPTIMYIFLGSTPAAGDALVLIVGTLNNSNAGVPVISVSSITGAGSSSWQRAQSESYSNTSNGALDSEIWYATDLSNPTNQITINLSGALTSTSYAYAYAAEYAGLNATPLDQVAKNYFASTSTTGSGNTGETATTGAASELLVGTITPVGGTSNFLGQTLAASVPSSGWSLYGTGTDQDDPYTSSFSFCANIVSATTQAECAVTFASSTHAYVASIATFEGAVSTTPPTSTTTSSTSSVTVVSSTATTSSTSVTLSPTITSSVGNTVSQPPLITNTLMTTAFTSGSVAGTSTTTFTSPLVTSYSTTTTSTGSSEVLTQTGVTTAGTVSSSTTTSTSTTRSTTTSAETVTVSETDAFSVLLTTILQELHQFADEIQQFVGFQVTATPVGQQVHQVIVTVTSQTVGQVTMTVSYSVVGGGSPTAPVFHYTQGGVSKSLTLSKTATAVSVDAGTGWSVTPNPLTGSSSSQRWYSTGTLSGTASATTIVFTFHDQYYLTMKGSGPGTVTPTSGWYNAAQTVTIKATANSGHRFNSWAGSGTGSYTGTSATHTITMNTAITETATFT